MSQNESHKNNSASFLNSFSIAWLLPLSYRKDPFKSNSVDQSNTNHDFDTAITSPSLSSVSYDNQPGYEKDISAPSYANSIHLHHLDKDPYYSPLNHFGSISHRIRLCSLFIIIILLLIVILFILNTSINFFHHYSRTTSISSSSSPYIINTTHHRASSISQNSNATITKSRNESFDLDVVHASHSVSSIHWIRDPPPPPPAPYPNRLFNFYRTRPTQHVFELDNEPTAPATFRAPLFYYAPCNYRARIRLFGGDISSIQVTSLSIATDTGTISLTDQISEFWDPDTPASWMVLDIPSCKLQPGNLTVQIMPRRETDLMNNTRNDGDVVTGPIFDNYNDYFDDDNDDNDDNDYDDNDDNDDDDDDDDNDDNDDDDDDDDNDDNDDDDDDNDDDNDDDDNDYDNDDDNDDDDDDNDSSNNQRTSDSSGSDFSHSNSTGNSDSNSNSNSSTLSAASTSSNSVIQDTDTIKFQIRFILARSPCSSNSASCPLCPGQTVSSFLFFQQPIHCFTEDIESSETESSSDSSSSQDHSVSSSSSSISSSASIPSSTSSSSTSSTPSPSSSSSTSSSSSPPPLASSSSLSSSSSHSDSSTSISTSSSSTSTSTSASAAPSDGEGGDINPRSSSSDSDAPPSTPTIVGAIGGSVGALMMVAAGGGGAFYLGKIALQGWHPYGSGSNGGGGGGGTTNTTTTTTTTTGMYAGVSLSAPPEASLPQPVQTNPAELQMMMESMVTGNGTGAPVTFNPFHPQQDGSMFEDWTEMPLDIQEQQAVGVTEDQV